VHFDTDAVRDDYSWLMGINSQLPKDISVYWLSQVADDFHARFSTVKRRYRYCIYNNRTRTSILQNRVTWHMWPLNAVAMREALPCLLGEHDFSAFRAVGCQANSPVKTMHVAELYQQGSFITVELEANGFLYHMVRNIVGSLIKIGEGAQPVEWLQTLLEGRNRKLAAPTAPAAGLYFVKAIYSDLEIPDNPLAASFP
jgi:tRNA pseudouridine38-40 synthase